MTFTNGTKLKTQFANSEDWCTHKYTQIQFGKPIKLPHIHNAGRSLNHNKSIEQRTNINNQKKKHYLKSPQINQLTTQQLELCTNLTHMKVFPKLVMNTSIENTQRLGRIKSEKNISKIDVVDNITGYKFGSIIGRGSYSTVRLAKNFIGKKFAIKTYLKQNLNNIDKRKNLQKQISILKQMHHPNILSFEQCIQTEDSFHIITQLIENVSLSDYLKKKENNCFDEKQSHSIFKQIIKAIHYMHKINIAHRDIKMENILISKDLKIKLIDFGFSTKDQNILHDFCGTPHYIAPQIINKKGYYGKPADIWSIGILFYKLISGEFPFKGRNQKNLYLKINKGQFKIPNNISSNLNNLLIKMLKFNTQQRITAEQILLDPWMSN